MTAPIKPRANIGRTAHPHVVRSEGTMGGQPRIEGWRFPVRSLYNHSTSQRRRLRAASVSLTRTGCAERPEHRSWPTIEPALANE